MTASEASMVLALADSFFFDVDLGWRVLLLAFLLVGFAPFLMVNAKLGPMIDRLRGGRRAMVVGLTISCQGADRHDLHCRRDSPIPVRLCVLQKAYAVTKQAIVPSVVRKSDLVKQTQNLAVLRR